MALQFPVGTNTRKNLKDWLLEDVAKTHIVLDSKSSDFGKKLWVAVKPTRMNPRIAGSQTSILCFHMEKGEESWGYTEYGEAGNPYVDCPDSIIDMVGESATPGVAKWRDKVRSR
tara:strand:- start:1929 stop:2273 length:345 start_codon:yes stop_codon:yes gene_type:complete